MPRPVRAAARCLSFVLCPLILWGGTAAAQLTLPTVRSDRTAPAADRYEDCLASAETRPINTAREARAWEEEGGGRAARHCLAIALLRQGEVEEAAWRLDGLAAELAETDPALAATLGSQAAAAWEEAGRPDRAASAHDTAVALVPADPDRRLDRAAFRGRENDFDGAIADLQAVVAAEPDNPTAHLLVAAAYRRMGLPRDGLAAIETALALAPEAPALLLERGNLHRVAGDTQAAAADWQAVLDTAPESPEADAAAANLDRLAAGQR